MKVKHITQYLFESYKDAKEKFSQEAPEAEVKQYLDTFKELAKKGKVSGQEKDIGYWIKQGWDTFKEFVDSKYQEKSKSQVKKSKKQESIIVYEDDEKMVVIPLSKGASCYYGKNTRWCTSSTKNENPFAEYFYINNIVLFYIFKKKTGKKYAAAYSEDADKFEYFDELDKSISLNQFKNNTSINDENLRSWYREYKDTIQKEMDIDLASNEDKVDIIKEDYSFFLFRFKDVDNDLIHRISQDKKLVFRLIYGSCMNDQINLLWNKIKNANRKDIFNFVDNYLLFSIENMSIRNIKTDCIENLFFQNVSEETISSYINNVKNNEEFQNHEYLRNIIWRIGFDYVSDKESYLKDSLDNNTIRLLIHLISNDLITDNMINVLKSHFSDLSRSKSQIENILQLIGSDITIEKLFDYGVINNNNIKFIIEYFLTKHPSKLNKDLVKAFKTNNLDNISIDINDQLLINIENNLLELLPIIKLLKEIPEEIKLSMIKYLLNNFMIGGSSKLTYEEKMEIFQSSILEKSEKILDGLLYPITKELLNDVKDYVKTI